ncbi:MAG: shikimate kinase, partial [Lachnospiraceae bacterium]|nr:shikimate kinase [Lachnospiraceae bacterium]
MTTNSHSLENISEQNIILIGMPTSGKSSAGVILAKILGLDFVDTDLLIQKRENRKLHEILS